MFDERMYKRRRQGEGKGWEGQEQQRDDDNRKRDLVIDQINIVTKNNQNQNYEVNIIFLANVWVTNYDPLFEMLKTNTSLQNLRIILTVPEACKN